MRLHDLRYEMNTTGEGRAMQHISVLVLRTRYQTLVVAISLLASTPNAVPSLKDMALMSYSQKSHSLNERCAFGCKRRIEIEKRRSVETGKLHEPEGMKEGIVA